MLNLLEKQIGPGIIPEATLNAVAAGMVLKEVYRDEVSNLSEKVSHLQKSLRSKIAASTTAVSTESLTGSPTSDGRWSAASVTIPPLQLSDRPVTGRSSKQAPPWQVPSQMDEMSNMLKEKDSIIKRKDEEYVQLRRVLQDTQGDLQNVLDLNAQYLAIISHYNQMQLTIQTAANALPEKSVAELEQKLSLAETRVAKLSGELDTINNETVSREIELSKLGAKQRKYRELLGISEDADDAEVESCIERLLADGSHRTDEIISLRNELDHVRQSKIELTEKMLSLAREKEKIEFHLRQQELTIKKIKRQQTARGTIQQAVSYIESQTSDDRIATQIKLPSIERIGSQIGLAAKQNRSNQQFCVFCRTEYLPLKAQNCRMHFRPIRNGKWTCCRDDCHRSPGCLQVPHFYMEITVDRKVFLTDGGRYMEITYLSPNRCN